MMIARAPILIASLVLAVALAAPAGAQTKYQPWDNPNSPDNQNQLLEELRSLVDQADRDRAASPQFLRDLRRLIRRYNRPGVAQALFDDFADGDYERNPRWHVDSGRFWVERGYGLRSTVSRHQAARQDDRGQRQDQARQIIGALLGQPPQGDPSGVADGTVAAIHVPANIENSFQMRVELSSWETHGRLELGVYQGRRTDTGYRLVYVAGATPTLRLQRLSWRNGVHTVATASQRLVLEDRRLHVIEWNRGRRGSMRVLVDGTEMILAHDDAYRDAFNGVSLVNRSGDFIVSKILVDGRR
ncbi:MAG: hypothetical protein H6907_10195 [Hyphomicrobiales bacterium]|nr:hypothetical protein [Hyphomicrobiales bacterium]MCP5372089.1 hypothetical protein [Hyphomicrobiales bacterium]